MAAFEEQTKNGKFKERVKFPYFVLLLSLILTIGATLLFHQSAKSKDNSRFQSSVNRIRFSMEMRINLYIAFLKAGRGFIELSNDLDHKKFTRFVESLEFEKNYIGAQGIGYSKTVKSAERDKLTAAMRADGFESFNIFPESEKEFYQPIVYIEPFKNRNEKAVGFDMSTEENRRSDGRTDGSDGT